MTQAWLPSALFIADLSIGAVPVGRVKMEIFADIVPKTGELDTNASESSLLIIITSYTMCIA